MKDLMHDFGFTAISESELDAIKLSQAKKELSPELEALNKRIELLMKNFNNFLDNLKMNPEKDYIYWANRVPKIEEFQKHLKNISEGK